MEDLGPSVSRLSSAMMRLRPHTLERRGEDGVGELSLMFHKSMNIISGVCERLINGYRENI